MFGLLSLASGAGVTVLTFWTGNVTVLALAALLCGVGLGLVFVSTLAIVNRIVPDRRRQLLTALFLSLLFLANSFPVVGIGFLADNVGLPTAVTVLATVVALLAFALLILLARRRIRGQIPSSPFHLTGVKPSQNEGDPHVKS